MCKMIQLAMSLSQNILGFNKEASTPSLPAPGKKYYITTFYPSVSSESKDQQRKITFL